MFYSKIIMKEVFHPKYKIFYNIFYPDLQQDNTNLSCDENENEESK